VYVDLKVKSSLGTFNVDEAQGIVECFVAAIGNKDSVGDIVVAGAFTDSLRRRKPRVVWGHDWNQPIGKVLEIYEVGATDPRLPQKMKAAGVGGLFARVQFNLKSERGREAFHSIVFFGEEQEWSIGYKTLDSIYSQERAANLLKVVELYEVSPVLHGANQLTATISIKSEQQDDTVEEKCAPPAQTSLIDSLAKLLKDSAEGDEFDELLAALKAKAEGDQADDDIEDDSDGPKIVRRIMSVPDEPKGDCGCGCSGKGTCSTGTKSLMGGGNAVLAAELSALVGRVVSFYFKSHAAHWNVEGEDFAQYHDLFGKVYSDVQESIDGWAENIRKLGFPAPGALFTAGMNATPETELARLAPAATLTSELITDNAALIESMKQAFTTAEELNEQGVADFIAGRIDMHQKWQWFLTASSKTAEMKSILDEIEVKAGRVIANRNMDRLRQALDLIRMVVEEGDPMSLERKTAVHGDTEYLVMDVTPESMFDVKSYLDDFADYHGAEVVVDEDGGEWIAIEAKNDEMMDVVLDFFQGRQDELQIKGFFFGASEVDDEIESKDDLPFDYHIKARRRIGWDLANAVYDANASDADGDGKVQDGTRFERPGKPKSPRDSGRSILDDVAKLADKKPRRPIGSDLPFDIQTGKPRRMLDESEKDFKKRMEAWGGIRTDLSAGMPKPKEPKPRDGRNVVVPQMMEERKRREEMARALDASFDSEPRVYGRDERLEQQKERERAAREFMEGVERERTGRLKPESKPKPTQAPRKPKPLDPKGDILAQYMAGEARINSRGVDDFGQEAASLMTDEELDKAIAWRKGKNNAGNFGESGTEDLKFLEKEKAKRAKSPKATTKPASRPDVNKPGPQASKLDLADRLADDDYDKSSAEIAQEFLAPYDGWEGFALPKPRKSMDDDYLVRTSTAPNGDTVETRVYFEPLPDRISWGFATFRNGSIADDNYDTEIDDLHDVLNTALKSNNKIGGKLVEPKGVKTWSAPEADANAAARLNGLPTPEQFDRMEKISGPLGSQGGGWFKDKNGQKYLVKPAKSEAHAQNELAAHLLYRSAGVKTDDTGIFERDGQFYIAKRAVQDRKGNLGKTVGMSPSRSTQREARAGYGIDALASSWDVFGMNGDNVIVDSTGDLRRIDVGGSLQYRAQGGPKNSFAPGEPWVEPHTMRASDQGQLLYGDMDDEEAANALERLQKFDLAKYDAAMQKAGIDDETRQRIGDTLSDRINNQLPQILDGLRNGDPVDLEGDSPTLAGDGSNSFREERKKRANAEIAQFWDDLRNGKTRPKPLSKTVDPDRSGVANAPVSGYYASEDGSLLVAIYNGTGTSEVTAMVLRQDGLNLSTPDVFALDANATKGKNSVLDDEALGVLDDLFGGGNVHQMKEGLGLGTLYTLKETYANDLVPLNRTKPTVGGTPNLDSLNATMAKITDGDDRPWGQADSQVFSADWATANSDDDEVMGNPWSPWLSDGQLSNGEIDASAWQKQLENAKTEFRRVAGTDAPDLSKFTRAELVETMRRYGKATNPSEAMLALLAHYQWLYAKN
jgi:HK97 family phage prohead protease